MLEQYSDELTELSSGIEKRFFEMRRGGWGAMFSDFEGEILYSLLRERKPDVVYEISPDCGYSTIYIAEAIIRNGNGKIYSFELDARKRGADTGSVIRRHALSPLSDENFELVIGDASQTTKTHPDPDIVLIDSCHDAWFAEWYVAELLPRVKDLALIQDIAFWDRREYTREAEFFLDYLARTKTDYLSLGVLERDEKIQRIRRPFSPRRPYQTNSILLSFREKLDALPADLSDIPCNNAFPLDIAKERAVEIENHLQETPIRQNTYRTYARLSKYYGRHGFRKKSRKYSIYSLAEAIRETSTYDSKAISELILLSVSMGSFRGFLVAVQVAMLYSPGAIVLVARRGFRASISWAARKMRN